MDSIKQCTFNILQVNKNVQAFVLKEENNDLKLKHKHKKMHLYFKTCTLKWNLT